MEVVETVVELEGVVELVADTGVVVDDVKEEAEVAVDAVCVRELCVVVLSDALFWLERTK